MKDANQALLRVFAEIAQASVVGEDALDEPIGKFREAADAVLNIKPHRLSKSLDWADAIIPRWFRFKAIHAYSIKQFQMSQIGEQISNDADCLKTGSASRRKALFFEIKSWKLTSKNSIPTTRFERFFTEELLHALKNNDASLFKEIGALLEDTAVGFVPDKIDLLLLRDWWVSLESALAEFSDNALAEYFRLINFGNPTLDSIRKRRQRLGLRSHGNPRVNEIIETSEGVVGIVRGGQSLAIKPVHDDKQ